MLRHLRIPKAALLLFLLVLCRTSFGVQITTTESKYEFGGVRHFFTVSSWSEGGGSFCNDLTAVNCILRIVGAQSPGNFYSMVIGDYRWEVKPTSSMNDVLSQMLGFRIPFKGSLFVPDGTKESSTFCISFAQGYQHAGSGGTVVPVGPCAKVKQATLQCDIKGNTLIDHHVVIGDAINGNEASTQLQLTCIDIAEVKLTAATEDPLGVKLRKDGSLYSKITINGQAAAAGVNIKADKNYPTSINLKSTLIQKREVAPGEFSGFTILKISPP